MSSAPSHEQLDDMEKMDRANAEHARLMTEAEATKSRRGIGLMKNQGCRFVEEVIGGGYGHMS